MQRIAFRLLLSSCVCVCVSVCVSVCLPRLWMPGKRFEIETFFLIARNNTGYYLFEFDRNRITNSKMADKMEAVKHYVAVTQPFINVYTSFFSLKCA